MGYGRYNSSYTSYGGGSYNSSSYGGGYTRGSPTVRSSSSYVQSTTSTTTTTQAGGATGQQGAQQKGAAVKMTDQKGGKTTQKTTEKRTSKKSSGQKTQQPQAQQKKQSTEKVETTQKVSVEEKTTTALNVTTDQQHEEQVVENGEEQEEMKPVPIVFVEGSFHEEKQNAKMNKAEKTEEEIKAERERKRREAKEREMNDMELQVTKHPKFVALQEKLAARLASKQSKQAPNNMKPPTGRITYGVITVKNTASFLELSLSNEEITLKTLEDIHEIMESSIAAHNIYKVEAEIGKFFVTSRSLDDMINMAMSIQVAFNEHTWDANITQLPMFRKLLRPEDLLSDEAVALFNGPRFSVGIHSGESKMVADESGVEKYTGENVIQVKTLGKFAQGGQIVVSSSSWASVQQTKLSKNTNARLGVFKLENFTSGCSMVEITPEQLQERAKFYGKLCSHCAKGIQAWEKSITKMECTYHEDHFRCVNCNEEVNEEGKYAAYQGLPHCHKCYVAANPKPSCKKCSNQIAKEYINALGAYWHQKCFACRNCSKRPLPSTPLFDYKGAPYCEPCHKKLTGI